MEEKNGQSDDLDLLLHKRERDEEAFKSLFFAYKDKLYSFLLGITRSEAKSEDLVQDIFMKIWQAWEGFSEIENVNAYVYRMAQNYAVDQLRKKSREILFFTDLLNPEEDLYAPNPADLLINKELEQLIDEAIDSLSSQQRKIFILHRMQGLSHEEIAKKLHLSVSTSQNHMRQALINMRIYLTKHYPEISVFILLYSLEYFLAFN